MTPQERAPKQIGRYEIVRVLGTGSMGRVYLGLDPDLHRSVAIKTLRELGLDEDSSFLERFRNEARAAAQLHHPNIVQVYDVAEEEEVGPYVVLEYVEGQSLREKIRDEGELAPHEVVHFVKQLASALTLAHSAGIIHRDVKPDNLLITADGDIKLADFGVARLPNASLTKEGQFLGTPCYAAPETIRDGTYGPLTDLFSMAAVTYEMVTGQRAFPGQDALQVAQAVLHTEPAKPKEIAPQAKIPLTVQTVILRGLSKDAAKRYEDATAFATALRRAYGSRSLPPSPRKGSRAAKAFVAAVLVALLIWGVFVLRAARLPSNPEADAGLDGAFLDVLDAAVTGDASGRLDANAPDATTDAETPPSADPWTHLSSHQREELAKDRLAAARIALASGDMQGALENARQAAELDPTNPDTRSMLEDVRSKLSAE